MSLLWPQGVNHNKVLLFVTDADSYMVKAAIVYRMIHITCVANKNSMKCIYLLSPPDYTKAHP